MLSIKYLQFRTAIVTDSETLSYSTPIDIHNPGSCSVLHPGDRTLNSSDQPNQPNHLTD
jgi:hypothetical protein